MLVPATTIFRQTHIKSDWLFAIAGANSRETLPKHQYNTTCTSNQGVACRHIQNPSRRLHHGSQNQVDDDDDDGGGRTSRLAADSDCCRHLHHHFTMAHSGFEDEAREHLLTIPDDSNGARLGSQKGSQRRKSSAHMSIRNLVEPKNNLLKAISVDIKAGQVYCIIGPSGSGKSTFLRAINRLWEPPADSIFLDGEDIVKMNVLTVRRRIGMLFQTPMLFDGTVADNVRYGPSLQGKNLTEKEVLGYLEQADIDASFLNKSIVGLSVGQAQRVALARTLANKPEVLLLDEPTSALDPISTHHIEQSVLELKRSKGLTVIMVSHSLEQVKRIADYVCLIVAGELLEVFKPTDLDGVSHPQAQEYLQAAQMH